MRRSIHGDDSRPALEAANGTSPVASILLVDADPVLATHIADLGVADLCIRTVSSIAAIELEQRRSAADALIISLDIPGAFDAIEQLCTQGGIPPVIAIASTGRLGASLEYTLTLAELRGASLSLPKPIDASELALAVVTLLARRRPRETRLRDVARELEKLTLF